MAIALYICNWNDYFELDKDKKHWQPGLKVRVRPLLYCRAVDISEVEYWRQWDKIKRLAGEDYYAILGLWTDLLNLARSHSEDRGALIMQKRGWVVMKRGVVYSPRMLSEDSGVHQESIGRWLGYLLYVGLIELADCPWACEHIINWETDIIMPAGAGKVPLPVLAPESTEPPLEAEETAPVMPDIPTKESAPLPPPQQPLGIQSASPFENHFRQEAKGFWKDIDFYQDDPKKILEDLPGLPHHQDMLVTDRALHWISRLASSMNLEQATTAQLKALARNDRNAVNRLLQKSIKCSPEGQGGAVQMVRLMQECVAEQNQPNASINNLMGFFFSRAKNQIADWQNNPVSSSLDKTG